MGKVLLWPVVVASCSRQPSCQARQPSVQRLPGLSGFVLLGLAGLRRAAAAGEITASGAGLSLDIGVNGQLGDAVVRGLALRRALELSGTSVGLRGAGASRPTASGVVLAGGIVPGQSGFVWLVIAVRRP
jgi:hypothetical protein